MEIKGIDVSKYQSYIDFNKVKNDGIEFVIIRASYGRNTTGYINKGVDEFFEQNYSNAKAAGLKVGAYHYTYARNVDQAREEAEFFLKRLSGKTFEYPVVLDIEDERYKTMSKSLVTDIAVTFLETLENAGYFAMIYSYRYFFQEYIDDSRLKAYAHWVAEWSSKLNYDANYGIWQYTSKGTVNGINTHVDRNVSYEDYEAIIKGGVFNGFNKEDNPQDDDTNKPEDKPDKDEEQKFKTIYVVKKGDTLSKIAGMYGTSYQKLAQYNKINNPNLIYPGQKIIIPGSDNKGSDTITYVVKKGDTLWDIANKYKTNVDRIVRDNNINNKDLIYPGQRIIIHGVR